MTRPGEATPRWGRPPFRPIVAGVMVLVLVLLSACGSSDTSPDSPPSSEPVIGDGEIRLTARWKGEPPEPSSVDVSGHEDECGTASLPDRSTLVTDGTLRNVVLTVESGPEGIGRNRREPVEIEQENCLYRPRVVILQTGQTLAVSDHDPGLHNVRATRDRRQVFNYSTYESQGFTESFEQPGVYRLVCDVHPWMEAWVIVTEHGQAAVTDETGQTSLIGLPPGRYELRTWHEEYGSVTHSVELSEGETVSLELTFPDPSTDSP